MQIGPPQRALARAANVQLVQFAPIPGDLLGLHHRSVGQVSVHAIGRAGAAQAAQGVAFHHRLPAVEVDVGPTEFDQHPLVRPGQGLAGPLPQGNGPAQHAWRGGTGVALIAHIQSAAHAGLQGVAAAIARHPLLHPQGPGGFSAFGQGRGQSDLQPLQVAAELPFGLALAQPQVEAVVAATPQKGRQAGQARHIARGAHALGGDGALHLQAQRRIILGGAAVVAQVQARVATPHPRLGIGHGDTGFGEQHRRPQARQGRRGAGPLHLVAGQHQAPLHAHPFRRGQGQAEGQAQVCWTTALGAVKHLPGQGTQR